MAELCRGHTILSSRSAFATDETSHPPSSVRPRRTLRAFPSRHDVEPELHPAVNLEILDPELVPARRERGEIERRFVEGPPIDDERAVHPDPHAVVTDGAEGVLAGGRGDWGRALERPARQGELGDQRAVPLVVEPALAALEEGRRAEQRVERLAMAPRIGAVAPGEEARGPLLGGLEAGDGEAVGSCRRSALAPA